MTLPPPNERNLPNLEEELKNLNNTYKSCREMFGNTLTKSSQDALDRIGEAIQIINNEIDQKKHRNNAR